MSPIRPGLCALASTVGVFVLGIAGPAQADGLQNCINQAVNHNGDLPTCTQVNGKWIASWPGDGSGSGGAIAIVIVIGVLLALGLTVWKVSTARKLATDSGMDPGLATTMTLLTKDGLDATYLAANLRKPAAAALPSEPPTTPAGDRLTELKKLLDTGLVTQTEYDERRKAIIDAV